MCFVMRQPYNPSRINRLKRSFFSIYRYKTIRCLKTVYLTCIQAKCVDGVAVHCRYFNRAVGIWTKVRLLQNAGPNVFAVCPRCPELFFSVTVSNAIHQF